VAQPAPANEQLGANVPSGVKVPNVTYEVGAAPVAVDTAALDAAATAATVVK
jgi:hypothetical protein